MTTPTEQSAKTHAERRSERTRQKLSIKNAIKGSFGRPIPYGRREGDKYAFLFAKHQPYLLYMAMLIMVFNGIDAGLTMYILQTGGVELNVMMDAVIVRDKQLFLYVKLLMTALCLVILVRYSDRTLFYLLRVNHVVITIGLAYCSLILYEVVLILRCC